MTYDDFLYREAERHFVDDDSPEIPEGKDIEGEGHTCDFCSEQAVLSADGEKMCEVHWDEHLQALADEATYEP